MASAPLFNWLSERSAGVLLHPTSLPGGQGVGTLDSGAERFLDWLAEAGMRYWQVCPLGPTGYGDSPYQCFSAFAGNPYLIDLGELVRLGLLTAAEVAPLAAGEPDRVDYGALYRLKRPLIPLAFKRFDRAGAAPLGGESFSDFKARHASWLRPYALFQALKERNGGRSWLEWPAKARSAEKAEASGVAQGLAAEMEAHQFGQYLFFRQWRRIREEAARRSIRLIGDIPIFVAADSADIWAQPELFELDPSTGAPAAVAGVPPDYFSESGQLWGNPLYQWSAHARDGFSWWKRRLAAAFELGEVVRIDHFRGFDTFWRIPAKARDARTGQWCPGPGIEFFRSVARDFPDARIIAEDLGELTPGVEKLREDTGLPGMAVLQFAFGGDSGNAYLPHNIRPNSVVYPGTHDNDTTLGWYASAPDSVRDHFRRYLRCDGREPGWDLIRCAYSSQSRLAILPMQDILSLGSAARMNTPGRPDGNWQWRATAGQLEGLFAPTAPYLRSLASLYGRS